jgi:hypothetical protein
MSKNLGPALPVRPLHCLDRSKRYAKPTSTPQKTAFKNSMSMQAAHQMFGLSFAFVQGVAA